VVCFEANPENIARLKDQLALLSRPVEMHAAAVWLQDGTIRFAGSGLGGAICRDDRISHAAHHVPCINFPRWMEEHRPESLVWKLDIEGAEAELLPATLPHLPRKTVCFLETHWNDERCREFLEPYRSAGFSLHEVRRRPWEHGGGAYVEWSLIRT
jgi:FkbM family methyltransferase